MILCVCVVYVLLHAHHLNATSMLAHILVVKLDAQWDEYLTSSNQKCIYTHSFPPTAQNVPVFRIESIMQNCYIKSLDMCIYVRLWPVTKLLYSRAYTATQLPSFKCRRYTCLNINIIYFSIFCVCQLSLRIPWNNSYQ